MYFAYLNTFSNFFQYFCKSFLKSPLDIFNLCSFHPKIKLICKWIYSYRIKRFHQTLWYLFRTEFAEKCFLKKCSSNEKVSFILWMPNISPTSFQRKRGIQNFPLCPFLTKRSGKFPTVPFFENWKYWCLSLVFLSNPCLLIFVTKSKLDYYVAKNEVIGWDNFF